MGEVLETVGEEYPHRAPEDTEARTRSKVLETCATEVAGEGDAEGGVEGEVTKNSYQPSAVSYQGSGVRD